VYFSRPFRDAHSATIENFQGRTINKEYDADVVMSCSTAVLGSQLGRATPVRDIKLGHHQEEEVDATSGSLYTS
jgi:hypothetical protein